MQIVNNISMLPFNADVNVCKKIMAIKFMWKKNYNATNILLNLHHFIKEISSEYSNTRDTTLSTFLPIPIIFHVSSNTKLPNLKRNIVPSKHVHLAKHSKASHSTLIYPG